MLTVIQNGEEVRARDHREPNHFWADKEIVENYLPLIGVHAFAVYMLLTYHARSNTGRAWPSIGGMAKRLGLSEPTIRKALAKLEKHKLILISANTITSKEGNEIPQAYTYTLIAVKEEGVVKDVYQGGGKGRLPGVVKDVYPNKNNITENKIIPSPPVSEGEASQKPAPKPRKANPIFDAVALGSFNMAKVQGKTGGRIASIIKEIDLCTPDECKATLAEDLYSMYRWYKETKPNLSAPTTGLTICKYLNEWRVTHAVHIPKVEDYVVIRPDMSFEPLKDGE